MWKKIFSAILILLLLAAGFIYFLLHSTWATKQVARRFLQKQLTGVTVESLDLAGQKIISAKEIEFSGLSLTVRNQEEKGIPQVYTLSVEKIRIFAQAADQVHLEWNGIGLQNEKARVKDGSLTLNVKIAGGRADQLWGDLIIPEAGYDKIQAKEIFAKISGSADAVKIDEITAKAFDGKVDGVLTVSCRPGLPFTLDGEISGFSFEQLRQVNPGTISKFNGRLSGTFKIEGDFSNFDKVSFNMKIAEGGAIDAALLEFIVYYIPTGTQQREVMNALLRSEGKVKVELASLSLENTGPNHLTGLITMKSRELNVDLNVPVELNIDGKMKIAVMKWERLLGSIYKGISVSFGAFKIY